MLTPGRMRTAIIQADTSEHLQTRAASPRVWGYDGTGLISGAPHQDLEKTLVFRAQAGGGLQSHPRLKLTG